MSAAITSFAAAVPSVMDQQGLWEGYFKAHYSGSAKAERLWRASGIETRHGVVDPRIEDVSQWGTGARMRRFVAEALPLGKEAVTSALENAGLAADEVGLFGVVTCTGYATPGVDILLARDTGMPDTVQRLMVGHMGCYAAIPGLAAVSDAVRARGLSAVMLCLELTSLHVQPPTDDVQQMVAHSLFSDAAAAVVLRPGAPGVEVIDIVAKTDVAHSADMTWDVTDLGFRMGLSPQVPDVLSRHVAGAVDDLLAKHGLTRADVDGWAVHPGGPRIIDVCEERLGLAPEDLEPSRRVLRDYGNCSSATVLLVLDDLLRTRPVEPGRHVVALAFGPGLTLYGALLRVTA